MQSVLKNIFIYSTWLLFATLSMQCSLFQTSYGAPIGVFYQKTTINHEFPKSTDLGSRVGRACVTSYAFLYSEGDAGVRAAAAEGGITTIRAVDYEIDNIFIFVMRSCTIVYGD